MTQQLQPGRHPDADQLSAFIDHALPSHEQRELLAHLSVCPECRAVVYVALPIAEDPAPANIPQPARRAWFSGLRLAFPAAIAVAALTAIIVYVYPTRSSFQDLKEKQKTEARMQPQLPADRTATASHAEPKAQRYSSARSSAPPQVLADKAVQPGPSMASNIQQQSSGALRMQNSLVAPRPSAIQAPPTPEPAAAPAPPAASLANQPKSASETVAVASEGQLKGVSATEQPAPPPPIEAQAVAGLQLNAAGIRPAWHPLPSKAPILSVVTHDRLVLAIDANHTVFLSTNSGKHWKLVPVPWSGAAVKAGLVSYSAPQGSPVLSAKGSSAAAFGIARMAPAAAPSLTGLVTDASGAMVAGARVNATDSATGQAHFATADSMGRYSFEGLPAGAYQLQIQAPGFETATLSAAVAAGAQSAPVNVTLKVGAATETVEVTSSADQLSVPELKKKKAAPIAPPPVFAITTDTGEQWISADGVTWKRK